MMYYLLIFTFAVCCRSSVCQIKFLEHLDVQEHKIRKRETTNTVTDNHDYYTSKVVSDSDGMYWNELEGHTRHHLSNDHYKKYSIIHLSFNFTFYGHFIDTFAITTQGFLYMSSFYHPKLNYTHSRYIAPLMANFDTIGNDSDILYRDYGDRCVIEWRNVQLNNQSENGNYTFQTTLFENGTILFSYKSIPETNISNREWPVKVGIADSYYYDIVFTTVIWRYIIRYHKVEKDVTDLMDNMAIILDPLPTCNTASSCDECTELKSGFNCTWCHSVSRCSDGFDRHRQEWLKANCTLIAVNSSDMCKISTTTTTVTTAIPSTTVAPTPPSGTMTPTPPSTTVTPKPPSTTVTPKPPSTTVTPKPPSTTVTPKPPSTTVTTTTEAPSATKEPKTTNPTLTTGNKEKPQNEGQTTQKDSKTSQIVIPIVVVCSVLLILVGVWVVYAYRHPNTASGEWLIQHRPSKLKEKFSNVSFSRESRTGDKVRIDSAY